MASFVSTMITPLSCYIFNLFATHELNTLEKVFATHQAEIETIVRESASAGTLYCGKCPDRLTKIQVVWTPCTQATTLIVRIVEGKALHR